MTASRTRTDECWRIPQQTEEARLRIHGSLRRHYRINDSFVATAVAFALGVIVFASMGGW